MDEVNLLDDEIVDVIIKVLSDGYVTVEREGLSVKYPCRPLMIATYNPQEGEIREHFLDRFAIALNADSYPLSTKERVMGVDNVIGFSGGTLCQSTKEADEKLRIAVSEEQRLRTKVEMARTLLQNVTITRSQIKYLCEEAARGACEGQRAELFATEIAKSSAALDGRREVNAEDLKKAVILAIIPRAMVAPDELSGDGTLDTAMSPSQSSGLQPITEHPPVKETSEDMKEPDQAELENDEEKAEPDKETEENKIEEENEEDKDLPIPTEFIFGVKSVKLSPSLLKISRWTRRGRGGKRAKIFSLTRGMHIIR